MAPTKAEIAEGQRELTRQYGHLQNGRADEEKREADRKAAAVKHENDDAERARGDVDSARRDTLQRADSLRSRATATLDQIVESQNTAESRVHLLRRRGDLSDGGTPAVPDAPVGNPDRALEQTLQVTQEALQELDLALQQLAEMEKGAARNRMALAIIALAIATGLLGYLWGATPTLLLFPVLVAVAIAAFRLDHGVVALDRLMAHAAQKRTQSSSKPWYSVARNYFGGLTAIRNSTDSISNPYVQSGTRAAATMYFTGSAAGVIVAAGYALVMVVVAVVVIGLVLWVIGKMLENA